MEALAALAGNGIWSLVAVIAIIVIFLIAIKKGILSFQGHGLSVGAAESEAKIRSMQQLYDKTLEEACSC